MKAQSRGISRPVHFDKVDGTTIPRDEPTEAVASFRGYIFQIAVAVEHLLAEGSSAKIVVEAFDDFLKLDGEAVSVATVRDRRGALSLTRIETLSCLERWAKLFHTDATVHFFFFSSQHAGNLNDGSELFKVCSQPKAKKRQVESLRTVLSTFVAGHSKAKHWPQLRKVFGEAKNFQAFWNRITWRLGVPPLADLIERVCSLITKRFPETSHAQALEMLLSWVGAMAISASSNKIGERVWTYERLTYVKTTDNATLSQVVATIRPEMAAIQQGIRELRLDVSARIDSLSAQISNLNINHLRNQPAHFQVNAGRSDAYLKDGTSLPTFGDRQTTEQMPVSLSSDLIADLNDDLRALLDDKGKGLWLGIRELLKKQELAAALEKSVQLKTWLEETSERSSPLIRSLVWTLLGQLHFVREHLQHPDDAPNTRAGREYYSHAIRELSKSETKPEEATVRTLCLKAKLTFFEDGLAKALDILGACSHPIATAFRLSALIDSGKLGEALGLARSLPPRSEWCALAAYVAAASGESPFALDLVTWALRSATTSEHQATMLAVAHGLLNHHIARISKNGKASPLDIDQETLAAMTVALSVLAPLIQTVQDRGRVTNSFEQEAVEIECRWASLVADIAQIEKLLPLLLPVTPVSRVVGECVFNRQYKAPPGIVERLRSEHAESLDALLQSAAIQGDILGLPDLALTFALTLKERAAKLRRSEDLGHLLFELIQAADSQSPRHLLIELRTVLGAQHRLCKLFRILNLCREGKIPQAERSLKGLRKCRDSLYFQLQSHIEEVRGDMKAALTSLRKAAETTSSIGILTKLCAIADESNDVEALGYGLSRLVILQPNSARVIARTAMWHTQQHQHGIAAEYFKRLTEIDPNQEQHWLNWANSLALSGNYKSSIAAFELCASRFPTSAKAHGGVAQALELEHGSVAP